MIHLEKSDDGSLLMDYGHVGLSQKIFKNFKNFSTMPNHFFQFYFIFPPNEAIHHMQENCP